MFGAISGLGAGLKKMSFDGMYMTERNIGGIQNDRQ